MVFFLRHRRRRRTGFVRGQLPSVRVGTVWHAALERRPHLHRGPESHPQPRPGRPCQSATAHSPDVSQKSGFAAVPGQGMGVISADYDNDGDTDIFVANDVRPNPLFQQHGNGTFREWSWRPASGWRSTASFTATWASIVAIRITTGCSTSTSPRYQHRRPRFSPNLGRGLFDTRSPVAGALGTLPQRDLGLRFRRFRQRRLHGPVHRLRPHRRQRGTDTMTRPPTALTSCCGFRATVIRERLRSERRRLAGQIRAAGAWFSTTWTTTAASTW